MRYFLTACVADQVDRGEFGFAWYSTGSRKRQKERCDDVAKPCSVLGFEFCKYEPYL